jgi:murein L,D-transpeptidase YcbB/YkuD
VTGCQREQGDSRIRRAEEVARVAAVFETPEPYSARTLDSTDLATFLAQHPQYRADSASMADFYDRRNMQFAWIVRDSLTAAADAFIALSGIEGFDLDERRPGCDSCAVQSELQLTAGFFEFAARNYGGHFTQDLRDLSWFIPRAKRDIAQLIDSLAAGTMDLSAYEPLHPQYKLLRDALQKQRALTEVPWPELALPRGTRSIKAGDSAQVLVDIRERLRLLGDLATADSTPGGAAVLDSALMRSVERFQARHGLVADGVIGPDFLRGLNVPPAERMRTLLVNMERMRWLPENQPANALVVNIPDFRLHVFEGDSEAFSMRIVVGATATRTVIFADTLTLVVMSPTWTLPMSIVRGEILPAIAKNPNYLRTHNMEIIGGTKAAPVIRQKPGPNNALGRVKFLFPNRFDIYMHDTPARGAFALEKRAFSHGCIRLAEPEKLANYLLDDDPEWTPERIRRTMLGGRETTVELKQPRPVFILYFTAWVDRDGQLNFRDDLYGHDQKLAEELFRE